MLSYCFHASILRDTCQMIPSGKPLPNRETNDLMVEVFRLSGLLNEAADNLVSKFGITGARWQVIRAIAMSETSEPVSRLARNMGLARQSVQRLVNEMVEDGILAFVVNPHHQRAKLVEMTQKGQKVFEEIMNLQIPWVKEFSKGISRERLVDAHSVLLRLRQRLESNS